MAPKEAVPDYASRITTLRDELERMSLRGVILAPGPNIRYYVGVDCLLLERPLLVLLPTEGRPHVVAPAFEAGPFARSSLGMVVHRWADQGGPRRAFEELSREMKLKGTWGVEGRVPFRYLLQLEGFVSESLYDAEPVLQGIRAVKRADELALLRKSAQILSKVFRKVPELLAPGLTELDLARKLTEAAQEGGAETAEVMVQSGKNAVDPHSKPSKKSIERNQPVVIDATCTYGGYFSDMTRTVGVGAGGPQEEAYQAVLEAQRRSIHECRPGAAVGVVDSAARDYLEKKGLSKYFLHRTGHGLGLEVHEAPYLVPGGKEKLVPGMALTVEPGVYVAPSFGVRIEDDVLVTEEKCDVITTSVPKEFGWWR